MPTQVLDHDGYHELQLSGRLLRDLIGVRLDGLSNASRILVDYSEVTAIDLPLARFVAMTRENDALGRRVAIYAPTPVAFGWNRQVIQLAGVREGLTVSVFKVRDAALRWLLADGPGARGFGGSIQEDPPFSGGLAWPA